MGRLLKGPRGKITFKRAFGYFTLLAGLALASLILHAFILSPPVPLSVLLLPAFFIAIGFSWSQEADPRAETQEAWSDPMTYAPIMLSAAILGAAYFLVHALSANSLKLYCLAAGIAAVALGVLLDLDNLRCSVRRTVKGEGPSGIPIIPLVLYGVGVAIGDQWLHTGYRPLLWLFVFHFSTNFIIPFLFGWFHFRKERARRRRARP